MVLISDKSLIAYPLEAALSSKDSSRRIPQKISDPGEVNFFAVGHMENRILIFYKRRDGKNSTFKVLEPLFRKSAAAPKSRRGIFGLKSRSIDYCRDFDDLYIPRDAHAMNLFRSSIAVSTSRGIEVLSLEKKTPISVPDFRSPDTAPIAARIRDLKPLGMFRINDTEFLLVYSEVAVYVNKYGDVSRSVVMEFIGRAGQACLICDIYLILTDVEGNYVEIRNAMDGCLKQVVSGKNIKLLYDGANTTRGTFIIITMQHPDSDWAQLILKLMVDSKYEGILISTITRPELPSVEARTYSNEAVHRKEDDKIGPERDLEPTRLGRGN